MNDLLKKVVHLIKPYFKLEIIGFLLTIIYAVTNILTPLVSKYLIDSVIVTNSRKQLYFGIGIFIAVCIAQPIVSFLKDIVFLKITEGVTLNIRKGMFNSIINAPMSFLDNVTKGDVISRIINDGRSASEFITNIFVIFIKNFLLIILIIGSMLYLSMDITLSVFILFGIYFIVNWAASKKFKKFSSQVQKNYDNICTVVNQSLGCMETIKSFVLEEQTEKRFNSVIEQTYRDNTKLITMSLVLHNLTNVVVVISLGIIYGYGALKVMNGELTLGTVIALGLYFQQLIQPMYELMRNNVEINKSIPIFDRIDEYFNLKKEFYNENEFEINGCIKLNQVNFAYDKNQSVLKDINLTLPHKGIVAFSGVSGSGKTTLIKLLLNFYNVNDGEILIDGHLINEIGVNQLRDKIGFVSQDVTLFNTTIEENLKCGNLEITDDMMIEMCKKFNMHKKISLLKDGYRSVITEKINLSGGEKQRLGIIRALLKNPNILILDEPTSALDKENEIRVTEALNKLANDKLIIIIAHRDTTIKFADVIYYFENGHVIEEIVLDKTVNSW